MKNFNSEPSRLSFIQKEQVCENNFRVLLENYGSLWHACTSGHQTEVYNVNPDDFKFSINNLAISAYESGATVFIDSHMGNHLHSMLAGTKDQVVDTIDRYNYRETKYLSSIGRFIDTSNIICKNPIEITDLKQMRNNCSYIARNGYLISSEFTPFNYPWGSSMLMFNTMAKHCDGAVSFNSIPYLLKRKISFRSNITLPESYMFRNGVILPSSYARIDLCESIFSDAHQYFDSLYKNVESYQEIADCIGDVVFLSDEELYNIARCICKDQYNLSTPSAIPHSSKIDLARKMHFEYHATKAQIRRILKIDTAILNEMFPPK